MPPARLAVPLLLALAGCDPPVDPVATSEKACLQLAKPQRAPRSCLVDGTAPERLSQTGCFADPATLTPGADLVPYSVQAPLWTDGAHKQRWLVLPEGEALTASDTGELAFPAGSVLLKQFDMPTDGADVRVETRVMFREPDGWSFYTYVWNEDGTDAERMDEGSRLTLDLGRERVVWDVPATSDCQYCHGASARVLGPVIGQLDREICYPSGPANQLETWRAAGLLDRIPAVEALVDPSDPHQDLADRARSYLHANCAHCHRPDGWTPPEMTMDLRYSQSFADTATCGVPIQYLASPAFPEYRIVPARPESSHLYTRMAVSGVTRMPPFGSRADGDGIALIGQWIGTLEGCP